MFVWCMNSSARITSSWCSLTFSGALPLRAAATLAATNCWIDSLCACQKAMAGARLSLRAEKRQFQTISAAGRHNKQLMNVFTCSCLARVALGELAPNTNRWLIRHAVRASRLRMLAWGPAREPGSAYDFQMFRLSNPSATSTLYLRWLTVAH